MYNFPCFWLFVRSLLSLRLVEIRYQNGFCDAGKYYRYQKKKKKEQDTTSVLRWNRSGISTFHFGFEINPTWNPQVFLIKKYPKILSTSVLKRTRRGIRTFHFGWRPVVESLHLQRPWSLRRIWNRRGMWFSPKVESPICTSDYIS
jgi:hypothetical protein